jgi:tRNA G26 N,N-dimethylase Trm1
MIKVNATLNTNGTGYWSNAKTAVEITGLQLAYLNDELSFGELRVRFTAASWDVHKLGLIYTDRQFMRELVELLTDLGYDASDVHYSEQGMQGDTYVSCDVGQRFINTFMQNA